MNPSEEFNYRVKIFIPNFYGLVWGDHLAETIQEAIEGLKPSFAKMEERDDGAYLYLFSKRMFPKVEHGDETPEGQLFLSASEGWKIKWQMKIKSQIVTLH